MRARYFFESWSQPKFDAAVRPVRFVQDNESKSTYGVLRGLHFQRGEHAQSKLVRVVSGRVLDVAVDIRRGSPTFGRHVCVELTGENRRQFFVPRGFAHGFAVPEPRGGVPVQVRQPLCPEAEGAIAWDDPALASTGAEAPRGAALAQATAPTRTLRMPPNSSTTTRITMLDILVTGADGQLGRSCVAWVPRRPTAMSSPTWRNWTSPTARRYAAGCATSTRTSS